MAYKTSYELHHQFPKIAEESGFAFNSHRPKVHIDWNKIKLIDVDNLIRERKFVLLEQHLNDILDCVLESEFDVRILDEGVLKLFRLAQLAVEYQQFCRHYLDRSVYILRQEITTMAQELENTKRNLNRKEEEIRKLKKRTRQTYKTPLPYGNDNIANMILKTLSNRAEIFQTTSNLDARQYNKCKYCEKVFLNQLYLKSHIERRHANIDEVPQKEIDTEHNQKLVTEITELKSKLKEMEELISLGNNPVNNHNVITIPPNNENLFKPATIGIHRQNPDSDSSHKILKDAEVSTNNDEYLINKLEEWKKDEQEQHSKEISRLKAEILETINVIKGKEENSLNKIDNNIIEQLHSTIKQQGLEILTLKEELESSKTKTEKENIEKYKEAESRVTFWIQKAEAQAKQYESLLANFNEVAKEAKKSRDLAEAEKERAIKLEAMLERNLNKKSQQNIEINESSPVAKQKNTKERSPKSGKPFNRETLEKLHKRAQELLTLDSISSTSTETLNVDKSRTASPKNTETLEKRKSNDTTITLQNDKSHAEVYRLKHVKSLDNSINEVSNKKSTISKMEKEKLKTRAKVENEVKSSSSLTESPMKLIRAKLTEEVNNRLVSAGVDPLKTRLPQDMFRKQRAQLLQLHELKSKKNVSYDKIRNSILTYLDENTTSVKSESNYINPHKPLTKNLNKLRGFTSVIENVKSKALSFVKGNEGVKVKRQSVSAEVTKKAMALLKTPPDSASNSPQNKPSPQKTNSFKEINMKNTTHNKTNTETEYAKENISSESDVSNESDNKYFNTTVVQSASKSMERLLRSPARRPTSASPLNSTSKTYTIDNEKDTSLTRSQSAIQLTKSNIEPSFYRDQRKHDFISSEDEEKQQENPINKNYSQENIQHIKQTKSVLKNASSTSSLNKKKVLFDMDAIQMKSVSASPSQSITEKSDNNEKYELGLVNLDAEEWDISSLESEPLQNDTKIRFTTQTAPKIAELKKKIESQLAKRNETPTTVRVGSVDVLGGSLTKVASISGSNTTLGSSILDESESLPELNHKPVIKTKNVISKNDSDLDISEFSVDELDNKNGSF